MSWWIGMVPAAVCALAMLAGCSGGGGSEAGTREAAASTTEAIYGGAIDNDLAASTAVVALRVGASAPYELCSGSLIAPNVVLTARHCVSKSVTASVLCDEHGTSLNGDHVGDDYEPAAVQVYTGAKPVLGGPPAAVGRAIFHPGGKILCNSDIALVVLDAPIAGITPLRLRVTGSTQSGEMVRSIGYGKNDRGYLLGTRLRKEGVGVLAVGAAVSNYQTALAQFEFEVGESICQGDSGGPAISESTGAVVGVVSRGGGCGDAFGHVYTQPSGFPTVLEDAFVLAGGAPVAEDAKLESAPPSAPPAAPPAKSGVTAASPEPQAGGCAVSAAGLSAPWTTGLSALLAAALVLTRRRATPRTR